MTDTTPLYSRGWNFFWLVLIALISVSILTAVYFFFNTLPPPIDHFGVRRRLGFDLDLPDQRLART